MSAALALQKAIRARLAGDSAVAALVPASSILDRNQRPAPDPAIILGEAQAVDEGADIQRRRVRIYHTVHIWKTEPSLEGVTIIMAAIRSAIHSSMLDLGAGFHAADCFVSGTRAMRDPNGELSHGVLTIEAIVVEVTP